MVLILHTLRFIYFFEDFLSQGADLALGSKSEWPGSIYAGNHGTLLEVGFVGRNCASEVLASETHVDRDLRCWLFKRGGE